MGRSCPGWSISLGVGIDMEMHRFGIKGFKAADGTGITSVPREAVLILHAGGNSTFRSRGVILNKQLIRYREQYTILGIKNA